MPGLALAQLPAVGVPKGLLRLEADGAFASFDKQFQDGHRDSYAADLTSPALGSDRIPEVAEIDTRIGRVIGNSGFRLNLGRLSSDAASDAAIAVLGLSYGLTPRVTVFGRMPLVQNRVQSVSRFDRSSGEAGLVPALSEQQAFFNQFDAALNTLAAKLAAGDYDATPETKTLAESILGSGTSIRDDLFAVLGSPQTSAPFAPTTTSAAGTAVLAQVTTLQSTLNDQLDVTGFELAPTLPTEPLTQEEFAAYLSNNLDFRPGQTELRFRGDAELGAAYTLVDRWDHGGQPGGVRVAFTGLLRLPTGMRDRPDRLLDIGSGQGQTDLELGVVTDFSKQHVGVRVTGTYTKQFATDINTRVTAPTQPLAGPERLTTVRWKPGDILALGARPFFRLARTLAIQASAAYWRHATDDFSYASSANAIAGVDANVLAVGSKASATSLGFGMTYANLGGYSAGGKGLPIEASWLFEKVASSGEGRVVAVQQVRASLRIYVKPF